MVAAASDVVISLAARNFPLSETVRISHAGVEMRTVAFSSLLLLTFLPSILLAPESSAKKSVELTGEVQNLG